MLLAIIIAVAGAYNFITNAAGEDCDYHGEAAATAFCNEGIVLSFSLANKRDDLPKIRAQLVLNLASVVCIIFFLHFIRFKVRKATKQADVRTITPADYTLVLKNVQPDTTDEKIRSTVEDLASEKNPVQVVKIVRAYNITEYVVLRRERVELKEQREMAMDPEELRRVEDLLEENKQRMLKYKSGLEYATVAYVTFAYAARKEDLVHI